MRLQFIAAIVLLLLLLGGCGVDTPDECEGWPHDLAEAAEARDLDKLARLERCVANSGGQGSMALLDEGLRIRLTKALAAELEAAASDSPSVGPVARTLLHGAPGSLPIFLDVLEVPIATSLEFGSYWPAVDGAADPLGLHELAEIAEPELLESLLDPELPTVRRLASLWCLSHAQSPSLHLVRGLLRLQALVELQALDREAPPAELNFYLNQVVPALVSRNRAAVMGSLQSTSEPLRYEALRALALDPPTASRELQSQLDQMGHGAQSSRVEFLRLYLAAWLRDGAEAAEAVARAKAAELGVEYLRDMLLLRVHGKAN